MAKGQGLPLEFIVIAAISALIIVLVIAFTIGGLGGSFKQIGISSGGDDMSAVQSACQTACSQFQANSPTLAQFQSSNFCTKKYSVDLNKNGKIESTSGETGLNCTAVGSDCTVQLANGLSVTGAQCKGANVKCEFDQGGKCNATCTQPSIEATGIGLCASGLKCCVG